jgi:hypothetical protein
LERAPSIPLRSAPVRRRAVYLIAVGMISRVNWDRGSLAGPPRPHHSPCCPHTAWFHDLSLKRPEACRFRRWRFSRCQAHGLRAAITAHCHRPCFHPLRNDVAWRDLSLPSSQNGLHPRSVKHARHIKDRASTPGER